MHSTDFWSTQFNAKLTRSLEKKKAEELMGRRSGAIQAASLLSLQIEETFIMWFHLMQKFHAISVFTELIDRRDIEYCLPARNNHLEASANKLRWGDEKVPRHLVTPAMANS